MRKSTAWSVTITLFLFAWVANAHGKRKAPDAVPPVHNGGVQYVVKHWAGDSGLKQNGGYVEAVDLATGKKLWGLTVYIVDYVSGLERDVQDVFITSMRFDGAKNRLVIKNSRDQIYWVDPVKRTATHVIRSSNQPSRYEKKRGGSSGGEGSRGAKYPDGVRTAYLTNCERGAEGMGKKAKSYCACTLNQIESKYTLDEFVDLASKMKGEELPQEFMTIVKSCL